MSQIIKVVDGETGCVWLGAIGSTALTLAQVNAVLTTLVLIGTVIYTWRKVLSHRGDDDK